MSALVKKDIKLGENDVVIKMTQDGAIKSVKGKITLEEAKGHLTTISGKTMVNCAGLYELNKIAGVNVITPSTLTLPEGKEVPNPFPLVDKTGHIEKVWVRKIAVGYGPTGNLVMTSSTLLYDVQMYLIQDLSKKIKDKIDAGRFCAESSLSKDEKEKGLFFPIDEKFGIWVDINNPDIRKALDTYIQNKLFAERKAQTICERNAMKKHPALAFPTVTVTGYVGKRTTQVPVIGYTHDLNQEELHKLAEDAAAGKIPKVGNEYDDVDLTEKEDEELDIKDAEIEDPEIEEKEKLIKNIMGSQNILSDTEFNKIYEDMGKQHYGSYSLKELKIFVSKINNAVDSTVMNDTSSKQNSDTGGFD